MYKIKSNSVGAVALLVIVLLLSLTCIAFADTGVPAVPEIQGISTGTSSNVQGIVTETDAGAWTTTNDPTTFYEFTWDPNHLVGFTSPEMQQLIGAGGSIGPTSISIPSTLVGQQVVGGPPGFTWEDILSVLENDPAMSETIVNGGIHTGVLDPGQVQYTSGYNDQYSGISGQQSFTKSMALSTANKIADQSNIKASTSIQFIAIDTGRATRSEDLLLDGASQAQDSANLILCPFANANPGIIPAFCNIEQAGSAFDTTLTSTVTSADTRFVGNDATIPVVLNYNINAQGITLSDGTSSPMIGSVSAYLKVHVQEARNESVTTLMLPPDDIGPALIMFPNSVNPTKSEDLVYSETSTASGLISRFSKSMSYSSQASAVQKPFTVLPAVD